MDAGMGSGIRGAFKASSGTDSRKGLFNLVANVVPNTAATVKPCKEQRQEPPINAFGGVAAVGFILQFFFTVGGMASAIAALVRFAAHREAKKSCLIPFSFLDVNSSMKMEFLR